MTAFNNALLRMAVGNSKHFRVVSTGVIFVFWDGATSLVDISDDGIISIREDIVDALWRRQVRRFLSRLSRAGVAIPAPVAEVMREFRPE